MRKPMILAALLLAGCATTGEAPDWVHGGAVAYPGDAYLLGRGAGTSVAVAQERARADLAKAVEVAVEARSEDRQRAETGAEGAAYSAQHEVQVNTRSEVLLRGLRIAELWRDPEGGEQHALAVLSRAQAAQALRAEIGEIDTGIEKRLAQARTAPDALAQLHAAEQALRLAEAREPLERMLRSVGATGGGVPTAHPLARLRADRDGLIGRLPVGAGTFDGPPEFAEAVRGALGAAGFAAGGEAGYVLDARLDAQDLGQQDGWRWLRASVSVVLRDAGGRIRARHDWAFKASASDEAGAWQRLQRDIARTLKQELRSAVIGAAE